MKVWIVEIVRDYEGSFVDKVFSSKEKALDWINNDNNKNKDESYLFSCEVE